MSSFKAYMACFGLRLILWVLVVLDFIVEISVLFWN